jgi:hypothetical protein
MVARQRSRAARHVRSLKSHSFPMIPLPNHSDGFHAVAHVRNQAIHYLR